jgi:hypothetical protein
MVSILHKIKIMKPILLMLALCVVIIACSKQDNLPQPPVQDASEIITSRPWIIARYGYDLNHNKSIEPAEDMLSPCEIDNVYFFSKNNTGKFIDNLFTCPGKPAEQSFTWTLSANGQKIDFVNGIADILLLTERDFVIANKNTGEGNDAKFLTVFTR